MHATVESRAGGFGIVFAPPLPPPAEDCVCVCVCACACVRVSAGLSSRSSVVDKLSGGYSINFNSSFSPFSFTREKWWIYPLSTPSKMPRKRKTEVRVALPPRVNMSGLQNPLTARARVRT